MCDQIDGSITAVLQTKFDDMTKAIEAGFQKNLVALQKAYQYMDFERIVVAHHKVLVAENLGVLPCSSVLSLIAIDPALCEVTLSVSLVKKIWKDKLY